MPRPEKRRIICHDHQGYFFKPRAVQMVELEVVEISQDEIEVLRLCYSEMLYQEKAAEIMAVSRQTVGRILNQAIAKVTDALLNGKALEINGGNVIIMRKFTCADCSRAWEIPLGTRRPAICPECDSANIHRSEDDRDWARRGGSSRGGGRGMCRGQDGRRQGSQSQVRRNQQTIKEK